MDLQQFLKILSVVNQEKYKSVIPPLDPNDPIFFWVFRNMDFKRWRDTHKSQVLWLSGPSKCNIHQVSSHVVDQEKNRAFETQSFMLYFFCSTVTIGEREKTTTLFIHTLLSQLIYCSTPGKKILIVKRFLLHLFQSIPSKNGAQNPKLDRFNDDGPEQTIKEILDAPIHNVWSALEAALDYEHELFIIIDGLDNVEYKESEFVREVRIFIEHLQKQISKVHVLLTSQPQVKLKEVLVELPHIEYDKERKGLSVSYILTLYLTYNTLQRVPS